MPTPAFFTERGIGPLDHISENEHWKPRRVYYATNRLRNKTLQHISYGNDPSDEVSLGLAFIGFGGRRMTWADLSQASRVTDREVPVELSIAGMVEVAYFTSGISAEHAVRPDQAGLFLNELKKSINDARDKDLLIYVHGAKVNFYNACVFTAQLDHFMGRDMTSIAFSWPTRQDLFAYAVGSDRQRAYDAAPELATLIEIVAAKVQARRIHILAWSAGARVLTQTFKILRERYQEESEEALRRRFRTGTAYFAAGDIPTEEYLETLPTINALVDRIVVTVTSSDDALKFASLIMRGGARIGQHPKKLTNEQIVFLKSQDRLEIIDVSKGRETRGFDITGHRYWFNHPWASTDVLLAIRTDLPPKERGLEPTEHPGLWAIASDYPQRLKQPIPTDFQIRK